MGTVTLDDAKADFDALIARVRGGEKVVIALEGCPVALVSPPAPELKPWVPGTPRPLGLWAGRVHILPGFDDPLDPEEQAAFDGEGRLFPEDS